MGKKPPRVVGDGPRLGHCSVDCPACTKARAPSPTLHTRFVMVHTYNHSTPEVEDGESEVQDHPQLPEDFQTSLGDIEILSQKIKGISQVLILSFLSQIYCSLPDSPVWRELLLGLAHFPPPWFVDNLTPYPSHLQSTAHCPSLGF